MQMALCLHRGREEFIKWNEAYAHMYMDGLKDLERKNPDQTFNSSEILFGLVIFSIGVSSLYGIISDLLRTGFWQILEFSLRYDLERKRNCHSWQVLLMPQVFFLFWSLGL